MQNTQTKYCDSAWMPVVLPEMEQLLLPLCAEQFFALEDNVSEKAKTRGKNTRIVMSVNCGVVNSYTSKTAFCEFTKSDPRKRLAAL